MRWMRSLMRRGERAGRLRAEATPRRRPTVETLEDRCLLSGTRDANQQYIWSLYQDDLGRTPSAAELAAWVPVVVTGGLPAAVLQIEYSAEASTRLLQGMYQNYLGRDLKPDEGNDFIAALEHGVPRESVASLILAAPEFYQYAPQVNGVGGGTPSDTTFVEGLFQVLVHHAPNATQLSNYTQTFLPQLGPRGVAWKILTSPEYRSQEIGLYYGDGPEGVLHRSSPTPAADVNAWLSTGLSLGQIHAAFETTTEKFGLPSTGYDVNQRYIQGIFQEALGRTGTPGDLTFWETVLLGNGSNVVAQAINQSAEARTHLIDSWYATFLGRMPGPSEEQGFVHLLVAGMPEEKVLGAILSTDEYYQRAPQLVGGGAASDATFIQALFSQLLERQPGAGELSDFTGTLLPTLGRQAVVAVILGSPEFRGLAVKSFYDNLLQRPAPPSTGELNAWVNSGLGLWPIQILFESTFEYFAVHPNVAALGDNITDAYAKYQGTNPQTGLPYWGSNGDRNWVEQLGLLRDANLTITDTAVAGATSSDLLAQGQPTTVASLIHTGVVNYAVVIVGANDIGNYLATVAGGGAVDPTTFVGALVSNVQTTLSTLASAGNVHLIVGNVPDIGQTPQLQGLLNGHPGLASLVTAAVNAANQQIGALAASLSIPVVDLYDLGKLAAGPLTLAGQQLTNLYAPDGFQPGTVLQGLLANTILEAAHVAYGLNVAGMMLSNQEIVGTGADATQRGYFDVSGYVTFAHAPAGSSAVLQVFGMM
jgi:lysophospholipase L1-like esterase